MWFHSGLKISKVIGWDINKANLFKPSQLYSSSLGYLGECKDSGTRDEWIGQGVTWEVKLTRYSDMLNMGDKGEDANIFDYYIGPWLL